MTTPAGVLVDADVVRAASADVSLVFTKVARGLYWRRRGELPRDERMVVRVLPSSEFDAWTQLLHGHGVEVQALGDEFWWRTGADDDDPTWTVYLFVVFGAVPIGVWQGRAVDLLSPFRPPEAGITRRLRR